MNLKKYINIKISKLQNNIQNEIKKKKKKEKSNSCSLEL